MSWFGKKTKADDSANPDIVYPAPLPSSLIEQGINWSSDTLDVEGALDKAEKLKLAESELEQAERMVRYKKEDVAEWEKLVLLRRETVERLKSE